MSSPSAIDASPLTVLSKTNVLPPSGSVPTQVIKCTELDSAFPDMFLISVVYFYPSDKDGDNRALSVDNLKSSLSLLEAEYPPLVGKVRRDETGRASIVIDAEKLHPVPFTNASASIKLDSLPLTTATSPSEFIFNPAGFMQSPLMPLAPVPNFLKAADEPVFQVQRTEFACGGVAIGFTYNHVLSDGEGWSTIINNWAAIARAQIKAKVPITLPITEQSVPGWVKPEHSRAFLDPTPEEREHPERFREADAIEAATRPASREWFLRNGPPPHPTEPLAVGIFRFQPAELKALKEAASPAPPAYTTTFEALTAHMFLRISAARKFAADAPPVRLSMVANARTRHQPPAAPGWFGNLVGMYAADFGTGAPLKVVPIVAFPIEGLAILLNSDAAGAEKHAHTQERQAKVTEGALEAYIFLKASELERLKADPLWRQYQPVEERVAAAHI